MDEDDFKLEEGSEWAWGIRRLPRILERSDHW